MNNEIFDKVEKLKYEVDELFASVSDPDIIRHDLEPKVGDSF